MVGRTLSHFRIVEKLGQGGMGVVYKAVDESLGRTVALKVLPPDYVSDEGRRKRLIREARLAASVTHANVATVYEVGEADGRVFVAMEFAEGISLRHTLSQRSLSLPDAFAIARGIARGLAKAHEKGVVHRDLKPDNVMIGEELEVKVLDFGLAKLPPVPEEESTDSLLYGDTVTVQTQSGLVVGTPGYMAPEQAAGKAVGPAADVFSFGAVFYEMVTGTRPFKTGTLMEVLIATSRDAPTPPSQLNPAVPPELERFIGTCMAKLPESRYQSGRELLRELERLDPQGGGSLVSVLPLPALPGFASVPAATPLPEQARREQPPASRPDALASALATPASADKPPPAQDKPAPAWMNVLGVVGLALAVVLALLVRHPDAPAAQAPSEAQALYASGLRELRDSVSSGCDKLSQAATLDPSLAAAHLRHALCFSVGEPALGRESFQKAFSLRASLGETERALLDAFEPVFLRQPADMNETRRRMAALAERLPGDAEVATLRGELEMQYDFAGALKALDHALWLDPKIASAWRMRAQALAYLGNDTAAFESLDRCLALSANATGCLRERININVQRGECALVEQDTRRWLAMESEFQRPYQLLAEALYAQGKPMETVREVLRLKRSKRSPGDLRPETLEKRDAERLALITGDFEAAEAYAREEETLVATSPREVTHAAPALVRLHALLESGKLGEAQQVAEDFLARREAWAPEPSGDDWAIARDPTAVMLAVVRRGGGLKPEAVEEKRRARLAWWEEKAMPSIRNTLWIHQYAAAVETPQEAADALAALPGYSPVPPYNPLFPADAHLGRTYLLGGRVDEALPILERMTRACYAFTFPVESTRSFFFLGQAREEKKDLPGACEAYAVVRQRWGNARPRSVTAERARARMKALGCP